MDETKMVSRADLDLWFVTDFYDIPLRGLAWSEGRLHSFTLADEIPPANPLPEPADDCSDEEWDAYEDSTQRTYIYALTPLYGRAWLKAVFNKTLFEICVGTHWTYKNGKRPLRGYGHRKPNWFWSRLFKLYYYRKNLIRRKNQAK